MFTINPNASNFCREIITDQEIQSYPKTLLWNKSTDCCSWDGVHCDEMTGQVIELDLSYSTLQGKFHSNSSLFQLSNLKRLDLSCNNFTGSLISPKFGEFSSLTHLDLSGTGFTGLMPTEISHLSKLHVLRFSGLYDLSLGPHNFDLLLKNLTQLRELNLDYVNISSTIPQNFSSYLKNLRLPYTNLCGVLPERVFHLSDLESLDLSNNPQLTVRFPTTKWNSSASLVYLYLNRVNITGRIPESFSHLTSLHELKMGYSNLSGTIPKPLWNLTNIESLNLCDNHLEGPISQFSIFEKLRVLSLRNNNFDGRLEFLSFNRSWMQLDSLDFSSNSLTGPIPSNVSGLLNLQSLLLSSNNLNGTIPSWIFSLSSLEMLDLSNNTFSGKIQEFKSKILDYVSLKQNKLEGPIPKSLVNQKFLQALLLSHNNINGQIASAICNLKTLILLNLRSNNELNDTFPKWLGDLPILQILNLRSNKFYGPIRADNLFAQIRVIDLSSNGFSGDLPVSLFLNFQAMKINDENSGTRENRFEGHIPNIIGDLIGLRTLNLSHNVLEGHIPASLQKLSALESLDLSSNKISGEIPQQLASLTFLAVLNLSHNHLVGCIPKGKQFETFENSSYKGNDGLRGLPPSRDCGGDDKVPQATIPVELDQEEEDSPMISWQAILMGYGCGLVIGLMVFKDGFKIGTQNYYETEKSQEKILVCNDLQDSCLQSC
ncbi:hypothetical protein KY290_000091 [Solanum tuberosum]|uniref:Leucine-rich repeat-containing N-terminal plant-type domain-containing protein n=1 Tax=Solanum tuberosum TaxID=4113 RepID=A0ABQ7WKD1_SOLTU|nr:hypothetical protein KY290_000091 [Solanum tuberosum]